MAKGEARVAAAEAETYKSANLSWYSEIWGRFRGDAWETASGADLSCLTLARALTRVRTRTLIRGKHIAKNESMVEACVEVLGASSDQAAAHREIQGDIGRYREI